MHPELDQALLRDLAQPLVTRFSPGEDDELFPLLCAAHFADPTAFTDPDRRTGPLAFGVPELVVLLTPVVLAAMTEAVRYVVEAGMSRGERVTTAAIRRLFRRPPAVAGTPADDGIAAAGDDGPPTGTTLALSAAEWSAIREIVERVALRGGVDPDRAGLIADAVVGQGQLEAGRR
ncbi:hypothetical protein [Polymorphospora rubra]|uniref:Uncharacterized protein n=1 Tax=Polymorphospora rubra TaxID=338584 RepID=A0A810MT54_9ACTN|nr:hypothetical protein [Polymorphospora rubra]BCJ63680.1 hypothetical protein Prubr_07010 [Polymorphospora rubra]